jgi:hypothetical protein
VRPRRLRRHADPGRPKVILRYTGRRGITAEQAREIKRKMRREGYDAVVVSGDWDVITPPRVKVLEEAPATVVTR